MKRTLFSLLLLLFISSAIAQVTSFKYRRAIENLSAEDWYSIEIPPDLFQKFNKDFSDIRILVFSEKDTIEIPYLIKIRKDEIITEDFNLALLNQSRADGKLFFTVQIPAGKILNIVNLNFLEDNIDALVTLEGSTDRNEWFELIRNKRIVSILQDDINYKKTSVTFPNSDYQYLRVQVSADKRLNLESVSFTYVLTRKAENKALTDFNVATHHENKQTIISIRAPYRTAINSLAINATHSNDYYRRYTLAYALDSIKTEKGWIQNYTTVTQGYLTSVDSNKINFQPLTTHELKLTIHNQDNPALTINTIELYGPMIEIITKLLPRQQAFLYYGNEKLSAPRYDLVHFLERIPEPAKKITLLNEEKLESAQEEHALFTKKFWLWSMLVVVVGVMAYFTLHMLKRNG